MFAKFTTQRKRRRLRGNKGQGISEYGAIIAFIALIVAMVFSIAHGRLRPAVSAAFSAAAQNLNNLSSTSANASS